jgi:dTDP-4-amino-4,6-dideoxygalactose transaminase
MKPSPWTLSKPVRRKLLPFHSPWLGKEEEKEVIDTLRSGWLTTGPKTKRFEKNFADYVRAKCAVGVNSCTAGLHLGLNVYGIGGGDEVITTPLTFAATVNVIVHQRARPVFVDVNRENMLIDEDQIESKITPRTKAILPVHFSGQPVDIDRIVAIAQRRNLKIVWDCAHAIETEYKGKRMGEFPGVCAFSLYANKNITTGEGGMVTCNEEETAQKLGILALHGLSKNAWKRFSKEGYRHYEVLYPGFKYNMFDIQASLGLHQLKKIDSFWKKRKRIVETYNKAFSKFDEVNLIKEKPGIKNAYYLYILAFKTEQLKADRDQIMTALQQENIGVGVHYRVVHLQPFYRQTYGFKPGDFPNAEYLSDRVVSLPLFPKMTEDDARDVIKVVEKVILRFIK